MRRYEIPVARTTAEAVTGSSPEISSTGRAPSSLSAVASRASRNRVPNTHACW